MMFSLEYMSGSVVAGALAYAISAYRQGSFMSKYAAIDAVEIFAASLLGDWAVSWVPSPFGLGREMTSDVLAGGLYALMRYYFQGNQEETWIKNLGYGFVLSYAGAALAAPVYRGVFNVAAAVNINVAAPQAESLTSGYGQEYGVGSGVPAAAPVILGGQDYLCGC